MERARGVEAASVKPVRIGLFGNFGSANLGNEASLDAMVRYLREAMPEAKIIGICRNPGKVNEKYGIATYPLKNLRNAPQWEERLDRLLFRVPSKIMDFGRLGRVVSGIDVLLIPGTGILDDYQERPTEMPFELFRWCITSVLLRRRIMFVAIGAGPIRNKISRWLMVSAAKLASYRSYRDAGSKKYLSAQGVDTSKDGVCPDLVFALPGPSEASHTQSDSTRPLTVGVGVMSYFGWLPDAGSSRQIYSSYLEKIARFVEWLLKRGYRVRLLIGSQSDSSTVKAIGDRVSEKFGALDDDRLLGQPAESVEDLMQQMTMVDVVVATRFHNVVCALKCAKPVLSFSYADKNDELLKGFGLGDFSQPVENIDFELLISQFERLVENRTDISARIRETNQQLKKSLDRQYAQLLDALV